MLLVLKVINIGMYWIINGKILSVFLILILIRRNFSEPQCESHSADFPSVFEHQYSRVIGGFDPQGPLPYQLLLSVLR